MISMAQSQNGGDSVELVFIGYLLLPNIFETRFSQDAGIDRSCGQAAAKSRQTEC